MTNQLVFARAAIDGAAFEAGIAGPGGEATIAETAARAELAAVVGCALGGGVRQGRSAASDHPQRLLASRHLRPRMRRNRNENGVRAGRGVLAQQMKTRNAAALVATRARHVVEASDDRLQ